MSAATGKRAANRARMERDIRRAAKQQLARVGPANLSLREVARSLDVAPSAVYRYVKDRDELLAILLQDASRELNAETLSAVVDAESDDESDDVTVRIERCALSLRKWALAHPHEWALLYATPVSGTDAETDGPTVLGTPILRWLVQTLGQERPVAAPPGHDQDAVDELDATHPLVVGAQEAEEHYGFPVHPRLLVHALHIWHAVIGTVSAEVSGRLGPTPSGFGENLLRQVVTESVWATHPIRHNGTRD